MVSRASQSALAVIVNTGEDLLFAFSQGKKFVLHN
jgi:hypothetical protein